ncbi:MAG: bifunctional adenosylcobinamide kinase/adenosylcobinamide-phosphate guanylyltransferase [Gammaproteobacteria bacterium]|nr:bifunctional adenosylcobinamide kinase/adenosylcobinamide-phosphate guanylyltransferase [Gammaproteobacteria bacterium]MCF6230303.1 bifunctional adenosylcobinamide kinase/adenosylcobinamide-phosphate guanylyltransferase [Gammaproteobacteria bacterium]
MKQLILGGARSGKSALAEKIAAETGLPVIYIATATASDAEMQQRINRHKQQRPAHWTTIESPYNLVETLQQQAASQRCILVDCLTLWLSNLLCSTGETELARKSLLNVVAELPGEIIFVSNEVGLGIIPMGSISRQFVDESGWLHQSLAQQCDRVVFTAAGLPLIMKGDPL